MAFSTNNSGLVAVGRGLNAPSEVGFSVSRIYYGVTAVVRFEGNRAIVSFEDPLAIEEIRFAGRPRPLVADLRNQLDAIGRRYPLKKKMVVVGHSMGGCISRLLITDSGNKLWMGTFGKPPEEVALSPESRKLFTDALIFRHREEVSRTRSGKT